MEIWLLLFEHSIPMLDKCNTSHKNSDQIKQMMIYVHEHYSEKISVSQLAAAAYLSERECFRVFHDHLHTTPTEYINYLNYAIIGIHRQCYEDEGRQKKVSYSVRNK